MVLWQVSDGSSTKIWNDKWIPWLQSGILQPMSVGGLNFLGKVKEWMLHKKEKWNWEAI